MAGCLVIEVPFQRCGHPVHPATHPATHPAQRRPRRHGTLDHHGPRLAGAGSATLIAVPAMYD